MNKIKEYKHQFLIVKKRVWSGNISIEYIETNYIVAYNSYGYNNSWCYFI